MERKGLGAVRNLPDNRNIPFSAVAAVRGINTAVHPKKRITDISMLPVEDQGDKGTCVGQAEGKGEEYRNYKETGKVVRLSKRLLYFLCKMKDGFNGQGTFPAIAASILRDHATSREALVPDNNSLPYDQYMAVTVTDEIRTDASQYRVKGYAFPKTLDEVKTAIDVEGVLNASLTVGDWDKLPVKPKNADGSTDGLHRILFYGYEDAKNGKKEDTKIYFRNSWGINWAKATTAKDKALQKEGNGWFWWSEYVGNVFDMQVYTDMPNELIDYARATNYIFTRELEKGSRGTDVTELQKRLSRETAKDGQPCFRYPSAAKPEYTAYYGVHTEEAVKRYQAVKKIVSSGTPKTTGYGRLGPSTIASLNGKAAGKGVYPFVGTLRDALVVIAEVAGFPIVVTSEYRSKEEQDALYAIGRTVDKGKPTVTNAKGGESFHNFRCAFDVAFKNGAGVSYTGPWDKLAKVAKAIGLEWGGDWESFPDRPHFQYTAGYSLSDFQKGRVDEAKFGVPITKAAEEPTNTQSFMKRVKSFFIILGSFALTAFVAVIPTVEFANFIGWLQEVVTSWGIAAPVWAVASAFVAQLWFAWRNSVNAKKAGYSSVASASRNARVDVDLY